MQSISWGGSPGHCGALSPHSHICQQKHPCAEAGDMVLSVLAFPRGLFSLPRSNMVRFQRDTTQERKRSVHLESGLEFNSHFNMKICKISTGLTWWHNKWQYATLASHMGSSLSLGCSTFYPALC